MNKKYFYCQKYSSMLSDKILNDHKYTYTGNVIVWEKRHVLIPTTLKHSATTIPLLTLTKYVKFLITFDHNKPSCLFLLLLIEWILW